MLKFYRKMQQTNSVNTIVCTPDLVIIKYFGNNIIEINYYYYLLSLNWN